MNKRVLLFAALIVTLVIAVLTLPVREWIAALLQWTAAHKREAYLIYIALYAVSTVCFLPGLPLTLAAGAIFGFATGSVLVSIGSTLGATGAFFVGRTFARDWIGHKLDAWPKFRALDRAVEARTFWIVFLTRLSPAFPFFIVNYAFGLTAAKPLPYVLATWLGMLPATLTFVYAGSFAASVSQALSGKAETGATGWALLALGFVATVAVTVLVTRTARGYLEREIEAGTKKV